MRKASVTVTFRNFTYWMNWYIEFLNKILSAQRVVTRKQEKKEILEAFVFKVAASWEILVEDTLVDCLNRDTSQYAQFSNLKLRRHLSRDECEAMITGLGYLDFRNVADLKKIAKNILAEEYNPFKAIPKPAADKIDEFFVIRNYLAHYSSKSKRSLMNVYQKYGIQRFLEPGDFLYANDPDKGYIRFGNYTGAFIDVIAAMEKTIGV